MSHEGPGAWPAEGKTISKQRRKVLVVARVTRGENQARKFDLLRNGEDEDEEGEDEDEEGEDEDEEGEAGAVDESSVARPRRLAAKQVCIAL